MPKIKPNEILAVKVLMVISSCFFVFELFSKGYRNHEERRNRRILYTSGLREKL